MTEHKHAEILRAIADGKHVQVLAVGSTPENDFWVRISARPCVCIYHDNTYRIEPEEPNDPTI